MSLGYNSTLLLVILAGVSGTVVSFEESVLNFASGEVSTRSLLLDLVNSNKVTVPPGVICNNCLIKSWLRRDRAVNHANIPISMLSSVINNYPWDMREALEIIQLAGGFWTDMTVTFPSTGELKTSLKVVNTFNNNVDIIIMNAHIKAELVPKNRDYYKYEIHAMQLAAFNELIKIITDVANSFV
ncbi:hypothetical protein BOX15_Mlig028772g2 [Macrostomum lignano]|uniref:Uncharacterized protein n=2 Tax=Macrostomum lignano TaxID=282301 RepID=A0A267FMZ5_9PLAT|nr:hypothetical protein BOX15_Mlig028772g1 [Macrostomum lignano]PAA74574.1 hypothetical protein BOX15_Mlig028772g2 [Macrostomum lignano]